MCDVTLCDSEELIPSGPVHIINVTCGRRFGNQGKMEKMDKERFVSSKHWHMRSMSYVNHVSRSFDLFPRCSNDFTICCYSCHRQKDLNVAENAEDMKVLQEPKTKQTIR